MMKLTGLSNYLDLIVSNEDVTEAKPHPMMYNKAMETLGVKPSECLILEDNEHGIQAAIASGGNLLRIGVPDDVTYQSIILSIANLNLHLD
jgi:HAD superfamily hydrolase (TIGR01509 family)